MFTGMFKQNGAINTERSDVKKIPKIRQKTSRANFSTIFDKNGKITT
jgi:hypothetical protein